MNRAFTQGLALVTQHQQALTQHGWNMTQRQSALHSIKNAYDSSQVVYPLYFQNHLFY